MSLSLEQLVKENDALRAIAARQMPCHYCGVTEITRCPHGFPGCALADDLSCGEISANAEVRRLRTDLENIASALGEHPDTSVEQLIDKIVRVRHEARDYANVSAELHRLREGAAVSGELIEIMHVAFGYGKLIVTTIGASEHLPPDIVVRPCLDGKEHPVGPIASREEAEAAMGVTCVEEGDLVLSFCSEPAVGVVESATWLMRKYLQWGTAARDLVPFHRWTDEQWATVSAAVAVAPKWPEIGSTLGVDPAALRAAYAWQIRVVRRDELLTTENLRELGMLMMSYEERPAPHARFGKWANAFGVIYWSNEWQACVSEDDDTTITVATVKTVGDVIKLCETLGVPLPWDHEL